MAAGSSRAGHGDPAPPELGCPTPWRHRVRIPSPTVGSPGTVIDPVGAVPVIALSCPGCADPSAAEELRQVVAARRRTLHGLHGLPDATRADLTAAGTLQAIYSGTLAEVRESARRCQESLGVAPPAGLSGPGEAAAPGPESTAPAGADQVPVERVPVERVTAVLDAAGEWAATLTG
jgi:hypothetical protein